MFETLLSLEDFDSCGTAVATEVGAWLELFCVVWFSLTTRVERSTRESGS